MLRMIGEYGTNGAAYAAVEFAGPRAGVVHSVSG